MADRERPPAPTPGTTRPRRGRRVISEVISKSFSIWARNFRSLFLLMAIVFSPLIAYTLYRAANPRQSIFYPGQAAGWTTAEEEVIVGEDGEPVRGDGELVRLEHSYFIDGIPWREMLAVSLAEMFLGFTAQAVVSIAVFNYLRDKPASVMGSLRAGLKSFQAVLAVVLLIATVFLIPMVPLGVGIGIRFSTYTPWGLTLVALTILLPFAVVWFVLLMLRLWVTIPIVVAERPGAFAAMRRSFELTKGHRWELLLVSMIVGAVWFGAAQLGNLVGLASIEASLLVQRATQLGVVALIATFATVAYHTLKDVDVPDLEKVFS